MIGQKVYSYDGGNKLTQEVANGTMTIYSYDANGNLTSKTTGTSTVRYYWDDEDKMVRLEDSVVMNFKTDGLGFRRYKEVVGQGVTYFVYDLAASDVPGLAPLIAEYDANGNLIAKYHHDGGGLLAMTRGNQSYWHVFEAIGTVRQLVNAQSQVTDAYAFDAWGNELAAQGSTVNPHRYVGKYGYYLDTQSALVLLGLRYYCANVGRFLGLDPTQYGLNWYEYVSNKPSHKIDPSGLQQEERLCGMPGEAERGHRVCIPHRRPGQPRCADGIPQQPDCQSFRDFNGNELPADWWNCMSQAFRNRCQGAPFQEHVFMTLVRCIIYGENRDRNDTIGPFYGPMQIHESWDRECRRTGNPNWRTDPCQNIKCGIYILCRCLRERGWSVRRCGHWGDRPIQFDAIEHPRNHGFCDCMRGCGFTCRS